MSNLFLRAGNWHGGGLPMNSYDGADMLPIPLEIAGQWSPHFDPRDFRLGGELAGYVQSYLGRGYDLMFYSTNGPAIATEKLNMTLGKRSRKPVEISVVFVRDHAGRHLRVTSLNDAKKWAAFSQTVLVAGEMAHQPA